jgi:GAF domain-containing protein/anti-sigma regulatory factor (Ser/Thr protein kinase)/anti-anti-sigma regulatory factor
LQALLGVTSALSGAATPAQVGAAVAEHAARALGGTGGAVWALAARGDRLHMIGDWGYDPAMAARFDAVSLADAYPVTDAVRERRTISVGSRERLLERYPGLSMVRDSALGAVPMISGEAVLGAVGVSRPAGAFDETELDLLEALASAAAQGLDRARVYQRLQGLQATTAALARALTPQEVAATAALQGAEAVGADSAWVALLDEERHSLELAHADGHAQTTRERFQSLPLNAELPLAAAVRTTTPLWLEGADAIFGPYPRFREVRPDAQAAALLPLTDAGEALGAIGLVFDLPRTFDSDDREYLVTLTRLCGQALGRARRYQTEHDLAMTLQQALLPEALPQADGLELAVRYLPAADDTAAGGDFYDALELSGGRLGIAVGDIVGHGPEAAAAMGQLRSALRAYALEGRAPARVLQLLSRYADETPGARGATLVYAVIDTGAREVRYASAGHPPPLLIGPDGSTRFLDGARGVPLDRALGHIYVDAVAPIPESSTLILYSDGAIERRGEPLDAGMDRMARAGALAAGLSPDALCTQLLEALGTGGRRRDDVALLAARVGAPSIAPLRLWFAARADQLAVVREAMRTWLASAGVPEGDVEFRVLAAGELCANAVEHAYAGASEGSVEVALAREPGGVLTLVVRDRGNWRPPAADPGPRGRGLLIVRSLMHAVDIDDASDGTTVSVRYRPGAAPPAPPRGPAGPPSVQVTRVDGVPVAVVSGEIDRSNANAIAPELLLLAPGPVIVDLSPLAFLGSSGLQVLFALAQAVALAVVAPVNAPYRRALEVAELGRVALIADTRAAALEHFARP